MALHPNAIMTDNTQENPAAASAKVWGNYWQGRTAQDAGRAMVGVERNAEIDTFWADVFKAVSNSAAHLDLACGAGTVLRAAMKAGLDTLTGLDISADALASVKAEFPTAAVVVASADAPPFGAGSFDIITSQFGVEYADIRTAAAEAAPLLRDGGTIVWLTHLTGGAIEDEVRAKAEAAATILDSDFTVLARRIFTQDDAAFEAAATAFRPAQARVLALAKAGDPLAAHLYSGTQKLFSRRAAYAPADIATWYGDTDAQIRAFAGRMSSMLAAAVDDSLALDVETVWREAGLWVTPSTILTLGGRPAARIFRAAKP